MTESMIYEGWVFEHPLYLSAHKDLKEEFDLVLRGGPRMVALVLGLSGTGKTELLQDVTAGFENRLTDAGQRLVLYVSFPPGTTADAVAARIIRMVLGVPIVQGTGAELRDRAVRVLESCGVRILVLDEANHAAEAHSTRSTQTKANRLTADWIKEVVDKAKVSVVMSGLPHSRRLLTDNDQLEGRALRPIELRPYAWHIDSDREAFRGLVGAFAGQAEASGWRMDVSRDLLERATYLTSRGLVRPVRRLFERAVLLEEKTRTVTAAVFARAFDKCFSERLHGNPFELETISDEMLNGAHRELLASAHEPVQKGQRRRRAHHD